MSKHAFRRGISVLGISLAVALIAIAPASYAQPQPLPGQQYQASPYPPPPPNQAAPYQYSQPPYGQPDQYGYRRQFDRGDRRNAGGRLDQRLAFLHQRLGITPAQEAAWTSFAGEVRNSAMERPREADQRAGNVVQRLELRQRMLEERSADLDREVRALRPLYAALSDDQKRIADQLLFRPQPGPGLRNGRPGF